MAGTEFDRPDISPSIVREFAIIIKHLKSLFTPLQEIMIFMGTILIPLEEPC